MSPSTGSVLKLLTNPMGLNYFPESLLIWYMDARTGIQHLTSLADKGEIKFKSNTGLASLAVAPGSSTPVRAIK